MRINIGAALISVLTLAAGLGVAITAPASSAARQGTALASPGEGVPAFGHVFLIIG